jgi:hypothetical protein
MGKSGIFCPVQAKDKMLFKKYGDDDFVSYVVDG